jgi:DNA adenine methylase
MPQPGETSPQPRTKPHGQLLKWVGNKYRFANQIVATFPDRFNTYIEPFVGTGAVLATLLPQKAIASDALRPLIEFWDLVKHDPRSLVEAYAYQIGRFNQDRQTVMPVSVGICQAGWAALSRSCGATK